MIELDKLLKSKYPDFETKLYFLQTLFEVGNYLNLSNEQKIWIENNRNNDEVDFYRDNIEYKEESFANWENINNLNDLLQLKKILKKSYIEEPIEQIKSAILQVLTCFVTKEDKEFYEKICKNIFSFQNISSGLDILLSCNEGMNKANNDNNFWILKLLSGESRLMSGRNCVSNCNYSSLSIFKAIKKNKYYHFSKKYYIKEDRFRAEDRNIKFYLEYTDNTYSSSINNISINNISINLNLNIDDKFFIKDKEIEIILFIKSIIEFQKNYREQMYYNNSNEYKTFSIILNTKSTDKEIINFKSIWLEEYKNYGTEIISNTSSSPIGKLETDQLIYLFQQFLLHMTIYIMSKYNICIKDELKLSNKLFLELVGLKLPTKTKPH